MEGKFSKWQALAFLIALSLLAACSAPPQPVVPTLAPPTLTVTVTATPIVCADDFESPSRDDDKNNGKVLSVGTTGGQRRSFDKPGDYDWLLINMSRGTKYAILTENLGSKAATRLTLYSPNGFQAITANEVDLKDPARASKNESRIEFTPSESGTYYVLVENRFGQQSTNQGIFGQTTSISLGGCEEGFGYDIRLEAEPIPTLTPTITLTPQFTATRTPIPGTPFVTGTVGPTTQMVIVDFTSVVVGNQDVAVFFQPAKLEVEKLTDTTLVRGPSQGQEWWVPGDRVKDGRIAGAPDLVGTKECAYKVNLQKNPPDVLFVVAANFGTSVLGIAKANDLKNPNQVRHGTVLTIPNCNKGGPPTDTPISLGPDIVNHWIGVIRNGAPVRVLEEKNGWKKIVPIAWELKK